MKKRCEVKIQEWLRGRLETVRRMHASGLYFDSFGIMTSIIVKLGACLDWHEWDRDFSGIDKERFNLAITLLLGPQDERYHEHRHSLWGLSLLWVVGKPGYPVGLTHRDEAKRYKNKHLGSNKDGMVVVVAEEFADHIEAAIERICGLIADGFLNHPKLAEGVISVPSKRRKDFAGKIKAKKQRVKRKAKNAKKGQ